MTEAKIIACRFAENMRKKIKWITVIDQKNAGVSAARNAGAGYCKRAVYRIVDSDDYIHYYISNICSNYVKAIIRKCLRFNIRMFTMNQRKIFGRENSRELFIDGQ
jgi:glycosyltransferase involved in cell wall biosynthesis